jgi:hypothetical protein
MDMCPIRFDFATPASRRARAGVQHRFQHAIDQSCWQWPGKLRRRRPFEGQRHRDAKRAGNRPFGRSALVLEA